jgi:hypothetical protein
MIVIWPVITIALFAQLRHKEAIIWSLLAGYLLLPVRTAIEIPVLIDLDKGSIIALSSFVFALAFARRRVKIMPRNAIVFMLCAVFVLSPLVTGMTNRDPLVFQSRIIPGMSDYDSLGAVQTNIVIIMPFLLGYAYMRDAESHRLILTVLVLAGLCYTLPMLVEMRLSPQLHRWVYGFFPHSFAQQMRGDGYRPVVFLGHGLVVAIFTCMVVVAAAGLLRWRRKMFDLPMGLLVVYLIVILLLCRSFGAIFIAFAFVPLAAFARPKAMKIAAVCAGLLILCYPTLRQTGVIGGGGFERVVSSLSADRAASMKTRTDNENMLMEKWAERPLFGWGTWGRNRVYEKGYGADISLTDGAWVSTGGSFGYVGYFASFGLLCFGLIARHTKGRQQLALPTGVLMMVLSANLMDLIPNSSLTPITWLLAGALCPLALPRRRASSTSQAEPAENEVTTMSPEPVAT